MDNKAFFAYAAFFVFFISIAGQSCTSDQSSKIESIGKSNELLLVSKSVTSDTNSVNIVYAHFAKDFIGLPQPEPWYKISHIPINEFGGVFKRHRTIIYLLNSDTVSRSQIRFAKDVWAKNQLVVIVQAKNELGLVQLLKEQKENIEYKILDHELHLGKLNAEKNASPTLSNALTQKFGIKISIPNEYVLAVDQNRFSWYRKETENSSTNIMVYELDYTSESMFDTQQMIHIRDSIARKYIPGPNEGSYMTSDKALPIYSVQKSLGDNFGMELRGLWKVENDFMGGPFLHRVVHNPINNKLYCIDFFVFAPKFDKRDYILSGEQIFSSIAF
ncbi:MAG TPA: DUF4837 family protein [Bacteroidia bacterium]|nr:DUF4837 family protein [Bacteroidia bacterium]HNT79448.1 DUF4837 family protein [Bacteroidia bacterium]